MDKPSHKNNHKQIIIKELIAGIRKGNVKREDHVSTFVKKWQVSVRTFDRYWKEANELLIEKRERLDEKIETIEAEEKINEHLAGIMTAQERKKYLSDLIRKKTKAVNIGGTVQMVYQAIDESGMVVNEILPTELKIKAIIELNKMEGDYAPVKKELTGKDGKPLYNQVRRTVIFKNMSSKTVNQYVNGMMLDNSNEHAQISDQDLTPDRDHTNPDAHMITDQHHTNGNTHTTPDRVHGPNLNGKVYPDLNNGNDFYPDQDNDTLPTFAPDEP